MRRAVMAFATAALLVGCGSSPGNTIELTISGAGPKRSVLVTEEGQGSCNGGKLRQVPSADVLAARDVAHDLKNQNSLPLTPTARAHRTFTARTLDGTVEWSELTRPLPSALSRAELLALKLETELCH